MGAGPTRNCLRRGMAETVQEKTIRRGTWPPGLSKEMRYVLHASRERNIPGAGLFQTCLDTVTKLGQRAELVNGRLFPVFVETIQREMDQCRMLGVLPEPQSSRL